MVGITIGPSTTGKPSLRPIYVRGVEPRELPDVANGERLSTVSETFCLLVTTGPETRLLSDPIYDSQILDLIFESDGGDCVITTDSAVNQTGNNTLTFAAGGDHVRLIGGRDGAGDFEWRVVAFDGVVLSTV